MFFSSMAGSAAQRPMCRAGGQSPLRCRLTDCHCCCCIAPSTAQWQLAGAAASAAASAATNEAAPLTRPAHYNKLLVKTTHDSTPVCLDVVRMTRKRNTWRMDLCQITVYNALRVGQYVDQSSSRGLEKFGEDILTSPEVISAQTLHFKPHFKFSRLIFFFGGGGTPSKLWCALSSLGQSSLARVKNWRGSNS